MRRPSWLMSSTTRDQEVGQFRQAPGRERQFVLGGLGPGGLLDLTALGQGERSGPAALVLDGVDLTVHPGETLALVGASGADKSTCAHLMARFWDPSEGRIQLMHIALARALLARPTVLILGESTAHLDNESDAGLATALTESGCTTVVIAHRRATIRRADRIAVLDAGHIVEQGTWENLIGCASSALNRSLASIALCAPAPSDIVRPGRDLLIFS
ncbi:ATP-binding cassette domain-containing protein (plasmid) [Streptomyces zhihengii]|uniref:ATP-binding cassette domain-containing protein n=1 Tax=Streptomyces zhihengii TaxID=1818004 RepID=A0ABS2V411_9ACTN|nr:ATP-binding cassette domain-containing protein [Streptomyces zhihengii]